MSQNSSKVVAAWGNSGVWEDRDVKVEIALGRTLHRIGEPTKAGHPRHPLYLGYAKSLEDHFTMEDFRKWVARNEAMSLSRTQVIEGN